MFNSRPLRVSAKGPTLLLAGFALRPGVMPGADRLGPSEQLAVTAVGFSRLVEALKAALGSD